MLDFCAQFITNIKSECERASMCLSLLFTSDVFFMLMNVEDFFSLSSRSDIITSNIFLVQENIRWSVKLICSWTKKTNKILEHERFLFSTFWLSLLWRGNKQKNDVRSFARSLVLSFFSYSSSIDRMTHEKFHFNAMVVSHWSLPQCFQIEIFSQSDQWARKTKLKK